MLERASVLDPELNHGAVWEVLMSFYAAAPESLGGGRDKALDAYAKALDYSKGQSPSLYIAYAKSFCVPAQDGAGFDCALDKALAIDPDSRPEERLALTIAHGQAAWLKAHKADYILE
jgi:predicted anti-sigma-YlaC factor YlaD